MTRWAVRLSQKRGQLTTCSSWAFCLRYAPCAICPPKQSKLRRRTYFAGFRVRLELNGVLG